MAPTFGIVLQPSNCIACSLTAQHDVELVQKPPATLVAPPPPESMIHELVVHPGITHSQVQCILFGFILPGMQLNIGLAGLGRFDHKMLLGAWSTGENLEHLMLKEVPAFELFSSSSHNNFSSSSLHDLPRHCLNWIQIQTGHLSSHDIVQVLGKGISSESVKGWPQDI